MIDINAKVWLLRMTTQQVEATLHLSPPGCVAKVDGAAHTQNASVIALLICLITSIFRPLMMRSVDHFTPLQRIGTRIFCLDDKHARAGRLVTRNTALP